MRWPPSRRPLKCSVWCSSPSCSAGHRSSSWTSSLPLARNARCRSTLWTPASGWATSPRRSIPSSTPSSIAHSGRPSSAYWSATANGELDSKIGIGKWMIRGQWELKKIYRSGECIVLGIDVQRDVWLILRDLYFGIEINAISVCVWQQMDEQRLEIEKSNPNKRRKILQSCTMKRINSILPSGSNPLWN